MAFRFKDFLQLQHSIFNAIAMWTFFLSLPLHKLIWSLIRPNWRDSGSRRGSNWLASSGVGQCSRPSDYFRIYQLRHSSAYPPLLPGPLSIKPLDKWHKPAAVAARWLLSDFVAISERIQNLPIRCLGIENQNSLSRAKLKLDKEEQLNLSNMASNFFRQPEFVFIIG